jgi:hypothetical protein
LGSRTSSSAPGLPSGEKLFESAHEPDSPPIQLYVTVSATAEKTANINAAAEVKWFLIIESFQDTPTLEREDTKTIFFFNKNRKILCKGKLHN